MSDLVVGEVRGYRAWALSSDGYLGAVTGPQPWLSATEEATCRLSWPPYAGDHRAPFTGCSCGLYAYYRATTVPPSVDEVFGVVAVAGRVILATRGMKAERMTMLALVTEDAALGERYGVPIFRSRKALLSAYPPQEYRELVDVDPTDPTLALGKGFVAVQNAAALAARRLPAGINLSGFGVSKKRAAEAIIALAAHEGLTAADMGHLFQHMHESDQAEAIAQGLDLLPTRTTGPRWRRLRWHST
jgi:hypothetical protein